MADTVIAPDLLPCPFCGGEAQIKMLGNDSILATRKLTARSKMRCGCEIGCSTFGCTVKVICCTLRPPLEQTRAWAIDKWNKRISKAEQENVALRAEAIGQAGRLPISWQIANRAKASGFLSARNRLARTAAIA